MPRGVRAPSSCHRAHPEPNNLEMSSTVGTSSSQIGDLEVVLTWSSEDPVSTFEMRRNDRIHAA